MSRKKKFLVTVTIASAFIYFSLPSACSRATLLIPTQLEVSIGSEVAKQIESQYKLLDDPELTSYVNDVGQRLVQVCTRQDVTYHFKILDTDMVNAFACPGGFIYVTTGILKLMDDEAELAVVLGHEIGHVAAKHGAKKLQAQIGYSLLLNLLFRDADIRNIANVAFNLVFLGYGRQDEFEADSLGTRYAYDAGYDPGGMIDFLRKLKELEGREPSAIEVLLRSHPPTSERIQRVEQQIQALPTLEGKEIHIERFVVKVRDVSSEESVDIDREKIILLLRASRESIMKQLEMLRQVQENIERLKLRIDELEKELSAPDNNAE